MTDLFQEIDDEMRAERARQAVRRYGWLAGLALVVVLVGIGGWQALAWRERQAEARLSADYLRATKQADDIAGTGFAGNTPQTARARDAALAAFAPLEASNDADVRTLARLRAAQLLSDKGDAPEAIRVLDQVAADGQAERALRDLAVLFSVERQMAAGHPDALRLRLATIEQPGGAFRDLAFEAQAAIDLAQGRIADARRDYETVFADAGAPQGARERASTLLQVLASQGQGAGGAGAGGTGAGGTGGGRHAG